MCVHYFHRYATREGNSMVKVFKNFKEKKAFKPDFGAEGELYFHFFLFWHDSFCVCDSC